MNRETCVHLMIAAACVAASTVARAHDAAFTYQGSLSENGERANGIYQLRLTLHNAETEGSLVAGPITNPAVVVANGLFTTTLDFGDGLFDGNPRWLEVAVATNGATAFTTLLPRQRITPAPYAITAAHLMGPLPANGLTGLYSEPVSFGNPANVFAGDGVGLTNVQAATLGGLSREDLWRLGGNSGLSSNSFLGMLDDQPLELRVNNVTGFRLQSAYDGSVNVIGGCGGEVGGPYTTGATIGGGTSNRVSGSGSPGVGSTISGGYGNELSGQIGSSTIAGGMGNLIYGIHEASTISGGRWNTVDGISSDSVIGGGVRNLMGWGSDYCTIGGGMGNSITSGGGVLGAGIGGGEENRITGSSCWSTVSGGRRNTIVNVDGRASTVGGGEGNTIDSLGREVIGGGLGNAIERSPNSVIGGGSSNAVRLGDTSEGSQAGCDRGSATISGGANNVIETNSSFSAIGGGSGNGISFSASATIAGGLSNRIVRASVDHTDYATIGGGFGNVIGAGYSTIPGGAQAKTSNYGQLAHASGQFSAAGDAQTSVYVCRGTTTNAEPAELFLNGVAERLMMPTNSTWAFDILVTGRASDGTSAAYHLLGAAKNIAGITTVAAQRKQTILAEDIAAWDATVVAHTTDNSLVVLASGADATSIRWVATVRTTEVTY